MRRALSKVADRLAWTAARSLERAARRREAGFTLMEVVVALIIGSLAAGGVMGVLSTSMRFEGRLTAKRQAWPALEAAAQLALARPEILRPGGLAVEELPGAPVVDVEMHEGLDETGAPLGSDRLRLWRVTFAYGGQTLETSVLIPVPSS